MEAGLQGSEHITAQGRRKQATGRSKTDHCHIRLEDQSV